jgi:hypothetical protein
VGTRPSAGIDLEPDEGAQKITNVRIQNSKFYDNAGAGILIAGKRGEITKIAIVHNVFRGGRAILIENAPWPPPFSGAPAKPCQVDERSPRCLERNLTPFAATLALRRAGCRA